MSPFKLAAGRVARDEGGGGGRWLDTEIVRGGAGGREGEMRSMEGSGTWPEKEGRRL